MGSGGPCRALWPTSATGRAGCSAGWRAWASPPEGGRARDPDAGRSQVQRDRRREARPRPGALVDRPAAGHGHRRARARRPRRRRRRRDDARRDAELRQAADRRAPVRVACGAVSDRPQRHAQDHRRRVARRRATGRCRSSPVPSGRRRSTTRRRRHRCSTRRWQRFLEWANDERPDTTPC